MASQLSGLLAKAPRPEALRSALRSLTCNGSAVRPNENFGVVSDQLVCVPNGSIAAAPGAYDWGCEAVLICQVAYGAASAVFIALAVGCAEASCWKCALMSAGRPSLTTSIPWPLLLVTL